ncbi:DUF2288 domain-containing protein [Pseudomonas sp. NW5]|uniref:DUF2288 domain-containing protein n=1 Tax=Pseudomonas sp. NW5 TaxID=2934934 RepID=UPI00202230FF|nr:DUF2288 domain-containing protein [Pseudomonas sp. NW5]MCL7461175.1 DUF2288 domain-containing protein [Pseudomonas sp. NW5]
MSEHTPLYLKLLGETATLSWPELQPFFARGNVLCVADSLDLIAVAEAFAEDRREQVSYWLNSGEVRRMAVEDAQTFEQQAPRLWAVVVAPWVLVQQRDTPPTMH